MSLQNFISEIVNALTNPEIFENNENSFNAHIKSSSAQIKLDKLTEFMKAQLSDNEYNDFCKKFNYGDSLSVILDPRINGGLQVTDPGYKQNVTINLIAYYSQLKNFILEKNPDFNIDQTINQAMLYKDQFEMNPEEIEQPVIGDKINPTIDKLEQVYGKDSEEIKEAKELLNFANANIKSTEMSEPPIYTKYDDIAINIKTQNVKEFSDVHQPIKNNVEFIEKSNNVFRPTENFIKDEEAVEICNNIEYKLSPEYKQFLKTFIPKLIEKDMLSSGEEIKKKYGFKQLWDSQFEVINSVNNLNGLDNPTKENADKLLQDLRTYKEKANTLDSLYEESKQALQKSPISSGNIDVVRTKDLPIKYRFDIKNSSHFNAMTYIAGFVKNNNINLDEFLDNPYNFINYTHKDEKAYKEHITNTLKQCETKADLLFQSTQEDTVFLMKHGLSIMDYRPFEALAMCEPNEEYRKNAITGYALKYEALENKTADYATDLAHRNAFKKEENFDAVLEYVSNIMVLEKKDINYENTYGGLFLDANTLKYEKPLDRTKYLKSLNEEKNLEDVKYDLFEAIDSANTMIVSNLMGGVARSIINVDFMLLGAQKSAANYLKAFNKNTASPEYKELLKFVKNPYAEYNKVLKDNGKALVPVKNDFLDRMNAFTKSEIVKEIDLEIDIDKAFKNVFSKDKLNKDEYTQTYLSFVVNQMKKLDRDQRTEEELGELINRIDKVMEESVFPKNNKKFELDLKHGGLKLDNLKALSKKIVTASAAVKEATEKMNKNLDDDNMPENEKVFRSAATLNQLKNQHAERKFSFFHIPSYFREWKAIKNLKQQILDSGITQSTLENAQRALDENPELMAAFDASPMATKLFKDAKDSSLNQYEEHKKEIHNRYELQNLNESLHRNLAEVFEKNDNSLIVPKVNSIQRNKQIEINQPNNQELNAPH